MVATLVSIMSIAEDMEMETVSPCSPAASLTLTSPTQPPTLMFGSQQIVRNPTKLKRKLSLKETTVISPMSECKRATEQYQTEQQTLREAQLYLESTGRRRGYANIYDCSLQTQHK